MKKTLFILFISVCTYSSHAQTINDLFNRANNILNGGSGNQNNNKNKEMSTCYEAIGWSAAMSQADFPPLGVY